MLHLLLFTLTNNCIVFYTGGSNLMSPLIYSDFFDKFKPYKIPVYKLPFGQNHKNIITDLHKNYNNVVFIGHSSGCTSLLNNCETINNIILLDPVKTPKFIKKKLNPNSKLLIINAERSYKWSFWPPFFPFIPLFKITLDDLLLPKNKIKSILVKNYGHCDILNKPYRNIMHYSRLSLGNPNRNDKYIKAYHNFLVKFILEFMYNNDEIII